MITMVTYLICGAVCFQLGWYMALRKTRQERDKTIERLLEIKHHINEQN